MNVMLWPPKSNEESWIPDVPNEGLYFDEEDRCLVDTFADYQGHYIQEPVHKLEIFTSLTFAPTKDQQYLEAYKIILEEFACCWNNTLPPEATWEKITEAIVGRLKGLGWQEVEYNEADGIWKVVQ